MTMPVSLKPDPRDRARSVRRGAVLIVLAVACTLVYSKARADAHDWVIVARDANYDIEIDRSRTSAARMPHLGRWMPVVDTWFRTNHKAPRLHNDQQFNREVVHSIVRCDSLWFMVLNVDMSMGDSRPISRQVLSLEEARRQGWRRVELGTSEEIAARAACHFGVTAPTLVSPTGPM